MDSNSNARIALFASGLGTNALALLHHDREVTKSNAIKLLICDKEKAPVVQHARAFNIPVVLIPKEQGEARESHERKILAALRPYEINWLFLAGYLRILSASFIESFYDGELKNARIINIHPSLLPAYPGLRAYERAFEDGCRESGVTVHFVSEQVDAGNIIAREKFARASEDTLEDFISRGKRLEHQLYVQVFEMVLSNRILSQEQI